MHSTHHRSGTDTSLERACRGLRERLRSGRPCRAEEVLDAYPTLAADPRKAVEVIVAEWATRADLGEELHEEEWLARFPHYRDELLPRLATLRAATTEGPTKVE